MVTGSWDFNLRVSLSPPKFNTTLHSSYSERFGAVKIVYSQLTDIHYNRIRLDQRFPNVGSRNPSF